MATIDTAAAGFVRKPIRLALIVSALGLALGGCETGSSLFGSNGDAAGPIATTDPALTPGTTQKAKLAVAPVIGAPDTVAKLLQTQLQSSIEKQKITVAKVATDPAEFTLRGYVVSAKEKTGTKVSYIWDVFDPAGKRVNRITGEEIVKGSDVKDPWSALTPQIIDTIATKTASSLSAWLPSQGAIASSSSAPASGTQFTAAGSPTSSTPTTSALGGSSTLTQTVAAPAPGPTTGSIGGSTGPLTALVPSVTGAPGDGSVALTSAIQRELSRNGVQLSEAAGAQSYKVEGKVSVGQAKDGKQPITIDWNVKDPTGKKLGTVSQKNEIAQGSLDGAWGKTADAAAAAAAQGIIKLLPPQAQTKVVQQ